MAAARRWQWGKSSRIINTIAAERLINETYRASAQGSMPSLARPTVEAIEGLPWVRARCRSVPREPGFVRSAKTTGATSIISGSLGLDAARVVEGGFPVRCPAWWVTLGSSSARRGFGRQTLAGLGVGAVEAEEI